MIIYNNNYYDIKLIIISNCGLHDKVLNKNTKKQKKTKKQKNKQQKNKKTKN